MLGRREGRGTRFHVRMAKTGIMSSRPDVMPQQWRKNEKNTRAESDSAGGEKYHYFMDSQKEQQQQKKKVGRSGIGIQHKQDSKAAFQLLRPRMHHSSVTKAIPILRMPPTNAFFVYRASKDKQVDPSQPSLSQKSSQLNCCISTNV
ncbi:hypothetical protein PO909_014119 [Leuciscus waleckii]